MTWERYLGGTHGFANMPTKKSNIIASLLGRWEERRETFHVYPTFILSEYGLHQTGALFFNAHSGKKVIKAICSADGKRFIEEV